MRKNETGKDSAATKGLTDECGIQGCSFTNSMKKASREKNLFTIFCYNSGHQMKQVGDTARMRRFFTEQSYAVKSAEDDGGASGF